MIDLLRPSRSLYKGVDTIPIRNWNLQRPPKLLSVRQSRYHTYKELKPNIWSFFKISFFSIFVDTIPIRNWNSYYYFSSFLLHSYVDTIPIRNWNWTSVMISYVCSSRYHTYKELKLYSFNLPLSFLICRYHTYKELKQLQSLLCFP